jgi:hypothetical protein
MLGFVWYWANLHVGSTNYYDIICYMGLKLSKYHNGSQQGSSIGVYSATWLSKFTLSKIEGSPKASLNASKSCHAAATDAIIQYT